MVMTMVFRVFIYINKQDLKLCSFQILPLKLSMTIKSKVMRYILNSVFERFHSD